MVLLPHLASIWSKSICKEELRKELFVFWVAFLRMIGSCFFPMFQLSPSFHKSIIHSLLRSVRSSCRVSLSHAGIAIIRPLNTLEFCGLTLGITSWHRLTLHLILKQVSRESGGLPRLLLPFKIEHLERARSGTLYLLFPRASRNFPHDWLNISDSTEYLEKDTSPRIVWTIGGRVHRKSLSAGKVTHPGTNMPA